MTDQQVQEPQQVFEIQKIFVKDVSFESPQSPKIFTEELNLSTNVELNTASRNLAENIFEVELNITVTLKQEASQEVAYLIEVKQAGVFAAAGFAPEQMGHMLGSYCPNILYPYAREVITDLAVKGGFPQMLLAPVNFDALYAQHVQQNAQAGAAPADTETSH